MGGALIYKYKKIYIEIYLPLYETPKSPVSVSFSKQISKYIDKKRIVYYVDKSNRGYYMDFLVLLKSGRLLLKKYRSRENSCTEKDIKEIIQYYKKQLKKYMNDILSLDRETEKKLKKLIKKIYKER